MPSEEQFIVDVTSPYSALIFPMLELITITGLAWIVIGYMDSANAAWFITPQLRNGFVGIWALLALWRFVLPVIRLRNRRVIVTDERITIRSAGLRAQTNTIPLHAVREVGRKHNTLYLRVAGQPQPIMVPDVACARRVQAEIESVILQPWQSRQLRQPGRLGQPGHPDRPMGRYAANR